MTDGDLIQTYVDLLIIQFSDPSNQPKALATIALQATVAIANQIVGQVAAAYSISTIYGQALAVGDQVDVLAQFVGAQRVLPNYLPPGSFYGFQDTSTTYDPTIGGMGDTTIGPPLDFWQSTNQVIGEYTLSDGLLIQLILYLAASDNAFLSVSVVDDIFFEFFGTFVTVDESVPMVATYTDGAGDPNANLFGIIKYLNAFPHPAGVEIVAI